MKSGIIALTALALLSGCATNHSRALPDIFSYDAATQNKMADEIESGSCPMLGNVLAPDTLIMRDQIRALKKKYSQ